MWLGIVSSGRHMFLCLKNNCCLSNMEATEVADTERSGVAEQTCEPEILRPLAVPA